MLTDEAGKPLPRWRVRLDVDTDPPEMIGLDIYGPVVLGRKGDDDMAFVSVVPHSAADLGVSRRHVELRPTLQSLLVTDLNSTNGTDKNGIKLRPNTPTPVSNRDTLSLGLLHVTLQIVDAPHQEADWFASQASLGQALTEIAKAVTIQLKTEDVLSKCVDYAMILAQAQEASLWLIQPTSKEINLEAMRGAEPAPDAEKPVVKPMTGSEVGEVALTGRPRLIEYDDAHRGTSLINSTRVHSTLFVPIGLGGFSLGVLAVSNRTPGHDFTKQDQTLLTALADFAAIALQNSRTLEATDMALRDSLVAQREATARALETTRLKTEFLATVSHELRSPLHTINGFSRLLLEGRLGEDELPDKARDAVQRILSSGQQLLAMINELLELAAHRVPANRAVARRVFTG